MSSWSTSIADPGTANRSSRRTAPHPPGGRAQADKALFELRDRHRLSFCGRTARRDRGRRPFRLWDTDGACATYSAIRRAGSEVRRQSCACAAAIGLLAVTDETIPESQNRVICRDGGHQGKDSQPFHQVTSSLRSSLPAACNPNAEPAIRSRQEGNRQPF